MKADRELYNALVKAQAARRLDNQQQIPIIILLSLASLNYLVTVLVPWSVVSFAMTLVNLAILFVVWMLMWRSWPR
jgi:hypothetical protein